MVLGVGAIALRLVLAGSAGGESNVGVSASPRDARSGASGHDAATAVRPHALVGLSVSNVTGPVERRASPTEPWRAVQSGDLIALHEELRTGSGGAAALELQDHTSIWMWPESQVNTERLDDELSRIGIAGGRVDVNVPRREQRTVEVQTAGGATATTQGARFSIIVDGAHVATVATREGEVNVISGTGSVRVPPGMQTHARPGEAPETVSPVPSELLLEVDWPASPMRSRTAIVRGHAPAGVLVSVGSTRVVLTPEGSFEQTLTLPDGDHEVEVTAEDVVGHRAVRRSPTLHVDTRPPAVNVRGRWE